MNESFDAKYFDPTFFEVNYPEFVNCKITMKAPKCTVE